MDLRSGSGPSGFHDRVAVVTGAARGIGAAVIGALAERGARVAAVDRDHAGLDCVAQDRARQGIEVFPYTADVRDGALVARTIERIGRDHGPIDILVNVAGVLRTGSVTDLPAADWNEVFDVNTHGVFHVSQAVARTMVPRRSGVIVTVGSNASRVPRVDMAAYAASKAATTMFTKCLGLELAAHGIRCNVVAPGSTDTPMQRALWSTPDGAAAVIAGDGERFRAGIPLRALATPEDIADAVVFLASDHARHITMHELCVDGGAALGA